MTTGKKFHFRGKSAGDRTKVLRKEIELIALENVGHREVIAQLQKVLEMAALTPVQARAVLAEIAWRRRTIKEAREARKRKTDSISHLKVTQASVQRRMLLLTQDNAERRAS